MALPMVYGGPGRYVQGPGELSRQGRYLSWLGCAAYVLFDQGLSLIHIYCEQKRESLMRSDSVPVAPSMPKAMLVLETRAAIEAHSGSSAL